MSRRFFYVHVQKAAGTELRERLKRHYAPEQLYPDPSDGDVFAVAPQVSVRQLLARWAVRGDQIEVITGHFPYCTTELLGAEFMTLSVLREPVARTLSHLRHHRRMNPDTHDLPLEAIYDDVFKPALFANHMVKMLSLTPEEIAWAAEHDRWAMVMNVDLDRERLERAKHNVAALDELGLHDRFDEFCERVQARFGWQLGAPLYANRTPQEEAPESLRARIAADNALDVELFHHASELYRERAREC